MTLPERRAYTRAMFLAPTPALSGRLVPLADGVAGVTQTLRQMRAMIDEYRTNMDVRQSAINLIFLQLQREDLPEVSAIFEFVRDNIRYVRDVYGVETIAAPDKILLMRTGDCDDKTVLLGAMLESVGYPTRIVVAGYNEPGELEHVYLQVHVDGQWINADATEAKPLGYAPPAPSTILIEGN